MIHCRFQMDLSQEHKSTRQKVLKGFEWTNKRYLGQEFTIVKKDLYIIQAAIYGGFIWAKDIAIK